MNLKIFALMLCIMPGVAYSAARTSGAVDGGGRASRAAARSIGVPSTMKSVAVSGKSSTADSSGGVTTGGATVAGGSCRDAFRDCMDEFCALDESEGGRCICSENIGAARTRLAQIKTIQSEADRLMSTETQRARLGAKADMVMAEDTSTVVVYDEDDGISLDDDDQTGDALYEMALNSCSRELAACGDRAEMEKTLYSRQIVADCKSYNLYLDEQKTYAEQNKNAAQLAVANARLEVLGTTDKYNRGECLLAYRACIADKGGCGVHFENCLDAKLLNRRANACDNILDQCMHTKKEVLKDWKEESELILTEAAKYSEQNKRQTCMAQIQLCLEDNCSPQTNAACLTDINVAANLCPIVDECEELVPGIKQAVAVEQLKALKVQFCENDVEACLKDKCGVDFTGPQCLGKQFSEIVALCPQSLFPTCKSEDNYSTIISSIFLQFDYKQLTGCANYFSEQLSAVCGTDMSCLPSNEVVAALTTLPDNATDMAKLRDNVKAEAQGEVDKFFTQFEKDKTVTACASAEQPAGKNGVGSTIFNSAKMVAQIGAQNRALRQLETKISELTRKQDVAKAEEMCYSLYEVETPSKDKKEEQKNKSYSYIRSVAFEPSLRNCHVCRMQQVCETGGEEKATSALKAASGGLVGGGAIGTQVNAGWGTAIGAVVGGVGAGLLGAKSGGRETFCQEIESCEDVNM